MGVIKVMWAISIQTQVHDLENFATASRRYTGHIHNSVRSLDNGSNSIASWLSAHAYYTSAYGNPQTS